MKKISIILLFLAAVCPLAQAQRVKVYVTDAWASRSARLP